MGRSVLPQQRTAKSGKGKEGAFLGHWFLATTSVDFLNVAFFWLAG